MVLKETLKRKRSGKADGLAGPPPKRRVAVSWPRATTEDAGAAWPESEQVFCAWKFDDQNDLWREVLSRRGWRDAGNICSADDIGQLEEIVEGQRKPPRAVRKHCFSLSDTPDEARIMCRLPHAGSREPQGGRWRLSSFPGLGAACKKNATTVQMERLGADCYPQSYILPRDRGKLAAIASRARRGGPGARSFWIAKPAEGLQGKGVVVMNAASNEFNQFVTSELIDTEICKGESSKSKQGSKRQEGTIVQRYIHNPMTIGGYKFHARIYVLVTQLQPTPMAYVYSKGLIDWTTRPFTLAESSLGRGFDPLVHISNWHVNNIPSNKDAVNADKPGIGKGILWPVSRLEDYLNKHGPISSGAFWNQVCAAAQACVCGIAMHQATRRHQVVQGRHHQILGLDVMVDRKGKVWVLEINDTPGMGKIAASTSVKRQLINDTVALLGMDGGASRSGGFPGNFWRIFH